ncbi:UNVERIFIED_CONTAM: hypothetical protein HDU68_006367 [Siphonaria sp. JEL0065]|nr:hypothetical protein HDU68_006367 [Siphonaria sp. JEL0065]
MLTKVPSTQNTPKKRFSFVSSPHSTNPTTPAQDPTRRVSIFRRKHVPPAALHHQSPSQLELEQEAQQQQQARQELAALILPTQILTNPSLLTQKARPLMSQQSHQHSHHHHHNSAPGNLAPASATSTNAQSSQDNYIPLDAYTLLNKAAEMLESSHQGSFATNRRMLKWIKMTRNWISLLEEEQDKKRRGVDVSANGDDLCSPDGDKLVACFKQSMNRVEEFLTGKNEGELVQNMIVNLQIAVDKENEFHEEKSQVEHAGGVPFKRDDVVQAFKDLFTIVSHVMVNKGATQMMVQVLRVVYSMLIGTVHNIKLEEPAVPVHVTAEDSINAASVAARQEITQKESAKGPMESTTGKHIPSLPAKATTTSEVPTQGPSNANTNPEAASTVLIPHDVLGDIMHVLTSHFLPSNLFKSSTSSSLSSTPPPKQSPPKAKSPLSHAFESLTKTASASDNAPATDLISIVTALWDNENDAECVQVRDQMLKLLETVEVLYVFAEHFLDDEETPGRGNLEISIDLGLKFIQRFIKTPITPLKTALDQLLPLFSSDILPKHGPCILLTLQTLNDAFRSPDLIRNDPQKLNKVASDFHSMTTDLYSTPLPTSANGESKFISHDTIGTEIAVVGDAIKDVWNSVGEDEFVRGLSEDGAEWWKALFVDGDGAVVVKISLWRDFTKLVLPALLVDFQTLTIPKLSYFDDLIKFELENVTIDVEMTLPNLCQLKVENGVLFGFNKEVDVEYTHGVVIKFFQIHLHMEQIPFKAHRSGLFKLSEDGFMDITSTNRGVTVSVQLEIDSAVNNPRTMVVNDVKVQVEDVELRIYGTKNDAAYHDLEKTISGKVVEALKESIEMELKSVVEKWDAPMTKVKKMYAV